MQGPRWTPSSHPTSGVAVGKGDHTFRLGEAERVGVGAILVSMIASFAVVTILACWAVPDSVGGLELSAKVAVVREWERASGTAGRCFLVVVLRHSEPLEAVVASVFYSGG